MSFEPNDMFIPGFHEFDYDYDSYPYDETDEDYGIYDDFDEPTYPD